MKIKFLNPALRSLLILAVLHGRAIAGDDKHEAGKNPIEGKIIAVVNDPFVVVLLSEGIVLPAKDEGIRAFFEKGVPGLPDNAFAYEQGADIRVPPMPVPAWYYKRLYCKDAADFLVMMQNGAEPVFASGAVVTDAGKIYFWGLEANDKLDVTAGDGQRFTLHCDPDVFEGTQKLLEYPGQGPAAPRSQIVPPLPEDVVAFANFPAKTYHVEAKYEVGRERVMDFLKNPKKADESKIDLASVEPFYNTSVVQVPPGEKARITTMDKALLAKLGNDAPCAAQGIIVTKNHDIYFWAWINEHMLFLAKEGGSYCYLVK